MELSIRRDKAVLLVVALGAGGWWWLTRGGGELPPLPALPGPRDPGGRGAAVDPPPPPRPARPAASEAAPAPAPAPTTEAPPDPPATTEAPRRVRTPDERARSHVALAEGYADNGRFDKAYEALDAAVAAGPSEAVLEEVEAARARVTAAMRERSRAVR